MFLKVSGRVQTIRMRLDVFGCVRMQLDAFWCVGMHSDTSANFRISGTFPDDFFTEFGCFLILGANYSAEIRIQGLAISEVNYSAAPL